MTKMMKKRKFSIIVAAVVTTLFTLGCVHRNGNGNTGDILGRYALKDDSVGVALESVKRKYKERFGREFYFTDVLERMYYDATVEDELMLLRYALNNNTPLPLLPDRDNAFYAAYFSMRYYNPGLDIDSSKDSIARVLAFARYESRFNKSVPKCNVVDEENSEPWPMYMSSDMVCNDYMFRLTENALRKNNTPIPYDSVVVTKHGAWELYYVDMFRMELPSWFHKYSDNDKVRFCEHSIIRTCGIPPKECLNICPPCQGVETAQPYLSKDTEVSIKTILGKKIIEHEKKNKRKMTELERVKTEFEIQHKIFERAVPICKQCNDDELLFALKILIQMNTYPNAILDTIDGDIARSIYQKYSKRKMSAAELIVAEQEIMAGKQILCRQCTDEDLLIVWKYFKKSVDTDAWYEERFDSLNVLPDSVSVDLALFLKENMERNPCCLRPKLPTELR